MISSSTVTKAIIHQSELEFIKKWILDYPDLETGGDFFGYWTSEGIPVIEFVIGPGKAARRTSTSFYQDIDYLRTWGNVVNSLDNGLRHIGAWHSHHTLSLSHPSGGDVNTMRNALRSQSLNKFLISIGNINADSSVTLNGFLFVKDLPQDYLLCAWEIKEGTSPLRDRLNKDPELASFESVNPQKPIPPIEDRDIAPSKPGTFPQDKSRTDSVEKPVLNNAFWSTPAGKQLLKNSYETISKWQFVRNCEMLQLADRRLAISFLYIGRQVKIIFPNGYPNEHPQVTMEELVDGFNLFKGFFNANKKVDRRLQEIIYAAGIVKDHEAVVIQHLS